MKRRCTLLCVAGGREGKHASPRILATETWTTALLRYGRSKTTVVRKFAHDFKIFGPLDRVTPSVLLLR